VRIDVSWWTVTADRAPTPFREFVLKVHQRCNLACDYCYVYTLADQSWRDRPAVMSAEVWQATAVRIAEHVRRHGLDRIHVVLHGGEPLLAGPERLRGLITDVRQTVPADVRFGLQTNGVLLDPPMLDMLRRNGVMIGVSLDGGPADHDRHRRRPDGRGSHGATRRALTLLTADPYRECFAGLLCVIDLAAEPVATYEALLAHDPPAIDLLLPHANWSAPPGAGYGDWLVAVFDRWYDAPRQETGIRLFEEIISLVLGGPSTSEQVGLSPVALVVVESDGGIEQVDSLRSAYPGASATGLNVRTDDFDAALRHPGIVARQIGRAALSDTCLGCPIHQVCGGGHYAHRYRPGTGFHNPSVYCADLQRLITHVGDRVRADVGLRRRAVAHRR
jgi:uncharacterized protein